MSQEYDVFGNLNDYLDDSMDLIHTPETSTFPDSEDLLDSPVDSPAPSVAVKKTTCDSSMKSVPSTSSSFNMSDLDKLQTEYAIMTRVATPANRRGRKSKNSPAGASTPKLKTTAAQKAKMAAELCKQQASEKVTAEPMSKRAKAKALRDQKKLLSQQQRVQHEQFLMEAMGIPINATSTRRSGSSTRIQAMLNQLFGSDNVPPVPEPPLSVSTRSRRRQADGPADDVVDLVTSPLLHIPGVVSLDSDDDDVIIGEAEEKALSQKDLSFDSENYEIAVKIKWQGTLIRENIRKYQKFEELIQTLAAKENAPPSSVILNLDDRIIQPDDTPESIGYTVSKFLSGRILSALTQPKAKKKKDANQLKVKIQIESVKKPLLFDIGKTQKMRVIFIKLAEELKCEPEHIRLRFDGEKVEVDSTPEDLEFEGGEILDCRMVK